MNAFKSLLSAGAILLAANTTVADEDHGNWVADFDVAVEMAKKENKDLLVDFTGSDWCGWCIKLHEEVFDHGAFLKPAMENYILVALDFPKSPELKSLVPNPVRNKELQNKYDVTGFPTILLMTASGEVFGRTGYQPGGPEAYLKHMQELSSVGKPAIKAAKQLLTALENATDTTRVAAFEAVIAKVQELGQGSAPGAVLIPAVKRAIDMDADNRKGLKFKGLMALLTVGAAEEQHMAAAREIDPTNELGLFELTVASQFGTVRSNEDALAALASLKALANYKDKQTIAGLFATGARWNSGPLKNPAAAKEMARKALDLGLDEGAMRTAMEEILKAE